MISAILAFLFGVLLLQQFTLLPDIQWCWLLIALFSLPFIPKYFHTVIYFILGFSWALLRAHIVLDVELPIDLQGKDVLVTGVISSLVVQDKRKSRFEFDIERLKSNKRVIFGLKKVRLSWYSNRHKNNRKKLKAGQRWQFWLRLKQPHGFMNPGGFDYEAWLYQKKIRATGYVRISKKKNQYAKKLDDGATGYEMLILRQNLYDRLKQLTLKNTYSSITTALAMGEREGITPDQWQVFRATGTSHLVAISGLHIGLLAGFVFFIIRRLWPYCGSLALVLSSPRAAALSALLISAFYASLSGFAIPAQRALIMIIIVMVAVYRQQKIQTSRVLAFALLGVLLLDPTSVLSAGFWLSFAAVAIIGLAALSRLSLTKKWYLWGRLQWRISLALVPLLLFLFQQASVISPLTNLVAIPVVSMIVVPVVLLATSLLALLPDIAAVLFSFADYILSILWWFLSILADTEISEVHTLRPSFAALFLAIFGMVLVLSPRAWPLKNMGWFLFIPLLWPKLDLPNHGEVDITLLDVGQGLATVVRTKSHSLVFDSGARFSHKFNIGEAVIIPYLRQMNITKLDMLILSHKDNDHRGGSGALLKHIPIKRLLSSYSEKNSEACFAGQTWSWDGVKFEMLNPQQETKYIKRNNASCVLRVSAGKESILFSADIEKKTETELVKLYAKKLKSKYLVSPHHGSKTSSSQPFIEVVLPEYVLIPVGYRNRYRMPHERVLQRYDDLYIKVLSTAISGAISLRLGQKTIISEPDEYRLSTQKYWNSRH